MLNAYDEIAYPSGAFRQTHPDRLGAHATLLGLSPAPVATARVLEIGAGDGSNLVPMAQGCPDARFVGFDLAAEPVKRGLQAIEALGLRNIRLFQADILDVDLGSEPFDYIAAQGVYSWAPPAVREALMGLVGRSLAPQGVACVSYNTLPGGYLRLAIRHELLFAVRGVEGRTARMEAAMRRLQAWPAGGLRQPLFQRALAEEAAAMKKRSLASFTHDELNDAYYPMHLKDFAADCAEHGLQVLGEAEVSDIEAWFSPAATPGEAAADVLERAQQADFAGGRFFRQPLLVRAETAVSRRPTAGAVAALHVSSRVRRVEGNRFEGEGLRFDLVDPPLADAVERLGSIWPATAPVSGLGLDAPRLLALVDLHCRGAVELQASPARYVTVAGERPMVSPLARFQAANGETRLTTLRHTMSDVDDEFTRGFVAALDGSRTRVEIARDIAPRFNLSPEAAVAPLGVLLDVLARAPLLVQ